MKKNAIFYVFLLTLTITSSGCLFMGSAEKQPEIYDLPIQEEKISVHPLRIGAIRNLSGADRRVQIREEYDRIRQTEDYLWLLPPSALLERKLKESFTEKTATEKIPVLHTLLRYFEFDLAKQEAFLGVNYDVILPDQRRLAVSGNYREKVIDEQYAEAMARAIRHSINDLDAALQKAAEK